MAGDTINKRCKVHCLRRINVHNAKPHTRLPFYQHFPKKNNTAFSLKNTKFASATRPVHITFVLGEFTVVGLDAMRRNSVALPQT
jgi:hypothetical protein